MPPDPRNHVLATTLKLIGQQGIAHTTVADVAASSGVGRASIYRWFPGGKDELMQAVVEWEMAQFLVRLADRVGRPADLQHLLASSLENGRRAVETHEQLQRVLATEPERLFPLMGAGERIMRDSIIAFLLPVLRAECGERDDLAWVAEEVARMFLSFIDSPGGWNLSDPDQVTELVQSYFLAWTRS